MPHDTNSASDTVLVLISQQARTPRLPYHDDVADLIVDAFSLTDKHTGGMATTMHRSLVWSGGRMAFVRDKGLAHTKKVRKNRNLASKQDFEHIKFAATLLHCFLQSNKNNINQSQTLYDFLLL